MTGGLQRSRWREDLKEADGKKNIKKQIVEGLKRIRRRRDKMKSMRGALK